VLHQTPPSSPQRPAFGRAIIVDDHPLFCDALSMTLRSIAQIDGIDLADRLESALARIEAGPPHDLVVLDLNLPDVDGVEGLIRLKQAVGRVPVLVVSSLTDARVIAACLAAGAAGYVPKHSHREVFRAAFDCIASGKRFLPEGFDPAPAKAPRSAQDDAVGRMSALTRQQARILQLICEGKLNKQIAWELSIAETTVKAHVTAIMRKLGVYSRTQAVLVAREISFASLSFDGD
jgi:DNA-binding NarL/FixJ family response regulator